MSNCRMCGAFINPGETTCSFCGSPVTNEPKSKPAAPVAPPTRPKNQSPVKPAPAPSATTYAPARSADRTFAPTPVFGNVAKCNGEPHLFDLPDWKTAWGDKRRYSVELGIILTNTQQLADPTVFTKALDQYVSEKAARGINYFVLDLNTQCIAQVNSRSCADIVSLLQTVYEVAVPDYLMIIGDSSVIPSMVWDNECGDDDETVPSDLPYITLDIDSPWSGKAYELDGITQVGRIPTRAEHHFSEAVSYFENTLRFKEVSRVNAWAYSAYVWEQTSEVEFIPVQPEHLTSPIYTCNRDIADYYGLTLIDRIDSRYNLLCFNLHGSDVSHTWYGQLGGFYPDAFDQTLLPDESSQGYVICTEACYGARPTVSLGSEQSIVVHALTNRCLAFVGSTRIAYGCSDGSMACADVIAGSFTQSISKGLTFGKAFLKALSDLALRVMDEEEIKTLAEFALYGDPSGVLVAGMKRKALTSTERLSVSKTKKDNSRAIILVACNDLADSGRSSKTRTEAASKLTSPEQMELQRMAVTISKSGKEYISERFESFASVEPKVYKVMGKGGYRAVYSKQENGVKSVVKLHMDQSGNVEKTYLSK